MDRYETRFEGETYVIESDDGWFDVGDIDDIYDLIGGKTYTIEYDNQTQTAAWLRTDADGRITFDVHDTLADMTFEQSFVENVRQAPIEEKDDNGYPLRTTLFADLMTEIWDSKGNLDEE
ncbi:hypothetical protein [Halococcus sp. PRR34]|uniref:hypothetical protein n=1 Tax=Halococcus sp. PRR34 TaxID=3020830 RepID=UPI0023604736|nr:hypothetical protein [Halococcus sp. PRR34]